MKAKKKFLASSLGALIVLAAVNVHAELPFETLSTREKIMAGVTAGAAALGIVGTIFGIAANQKIKPGTLDDGKIFELKFLRAYVEAKKHELDAEVGKVSNKLSNETSLMVWYLEDEIGRNVVVVTDDYFESIGQEQDGRGAKNVDHGTIDREGIVIDLSNLPNDSNARVLTFSKSACLGSAREAIEEKLTETNKRIKAAENILYGIERKLAGKAGDWFSLSDEEIFDIVDSLDRRMNRRPPITFSEVDSLFRFGVLKNEWNTVQHKDSCYYLPSKLNAVNRVLPSDYIDRDDDALKFVTLCHDESQLRNFFFGLIKEYIPENLNSPYDAMRAEENLCNIRLLWDIIGDTNNVVECFFKNFHSLVSDSIDGKASSDSISEYTRGLT